MILSACLVLLLALGVLERILTARARRAVPIRVHVNGTRGKSTVTRLVAAGLREAGIRTVAKVTGTAPRLILPDAVERPIARRAPASIREQSWLVRRAAREGATALVAECMAVRPDLQRVSEREMVRATIGVITNVRLDHTDVMGQSPDEICASLSGTIPRGGVLVLGDRRFAPALAPRCAALGTRLVVVDGPRSAGPANGRASWFDHDLAIALAITREVGLDDAVALRGMRAAASDPGAARHGVAKTGAGDIRWIDATAANDPESLDLVVDGGSPAGEGRSGPPGAEPIVAVYNHRADRPERLRSFARSSATVRGAATILLTGERPSLTLVASVRRLCPAATVRFVPRRRLEAALADLGATTIYCGNTRGFERPFGSSNNKRPSTNNHA